jgi:hypothetical protein
MVVKPVFLASTAPQEVRRVFLCALTAPQENIHRNLAHGRHPHVKIVPLANFFCKQLQIVTLCAKTALQANSIWRQGWEKSVRNALLEHTAVRLVQAIKQRAFLVLWDDLAVLLVQVMYLPAKFAQLACLEM